MITGLGLVTPLGIGTEQNWSALLSGRSGIREIDLFDPTGYAVRIAGQVWDFEASKCFKPKELKKMDRFAQFALLAARLAGEDAGLPTPVPEPDSERTGVVIGSGLGGLDTIQNTIETIQSQGPSRVRPFTIPRIIANMGPGIVSIEFGARGPNLSTVSACATGSHCVGDAARLIAMDEADVMIAGGAEATIGPVALSGFASMKALSTRNSEPERASRPFDADRDGFVCSEGAGVVVLELLESAQRRGARIYAEVAGYGQSADAYHMTAPDPTGRGAQKAMRNAIADAGLDPSDIQYINAHGTSTRFNDPIESQSIEKVFGDHARELWVSSTKSCTGHMLGAAGAVEAIYTALALAHQKVPPTINYETPDPECGLDYVPGESRSGRIEVALSNSFGFGGANVCLVLKRYRD